MSTESVKIVMKGVDQATPVINQVNAKLKDTGKIGNGVAGVLGNLGLELGGFGEYTQTFQQITNQMDEVGEALEKVGPKTAKLGGLLRGLGPAAAVVGTAVASVGIGVKIGEWITGADKFRESLSKVSDELKNINERRIKAQTEQITLDIKLAMIAPDEATRIKQLDEIQAKIKDNIEKEKTGVEDQIKYVNQLREEYANAAMIDKKAKAQNLQIAVDDLNRRTEGLQTLNQEQEKLTKQREEEAAISAKTKQVENQKKLDDFIRSTRAETDKINRSMMTAEELREQEKKDLQQILVNVKDLAYSDKAAAESALKQRHEAERLAESKELAKKTGEEILKQTEDLEGKTKDLLKSMLSEEELQVQVKKDRDAQREALEKQLSIANQLTEAEKNRARAALESTFAAEDESKIKAKQTEMAKKQSDLLEELRIKTIELTQGEEAANRARLQQQGFTQEQIDKIITEQNRVKDLEKTLTDLASQREQVAKGEGPQQVQQASRLARLGSGRNVNTEQLKKLDMQIQAVKEQAKKQDGTNTILTRIENKLNFPVK